MLGLKGWCLHENKNKWSNWAPKGNCFTDNFIMHKRNEPNLGKGQLTKGTCFIGSHFVLENYPNMMTFDFFFLQIWQNFAHLFSKNPFNTSHHIIFCRNSVIIPNPKKLIPMIIQSMFICIYNFWCYSSGNSP
jgi:hypothetical protein